ncbi:MAG: dihydroorotate dehydrogenase electron transfer subunit [Chloroflexota bacterium]
MRQTTVSVTGREELSGGIHLLRLDSPWLAGAARPGQFVEIRCGEGSDPLLRRPLSVHRARSAQAQTPGLLAPGEVNLLFKAVGRGTEWLAKRRSGDQLDLFGPLGRGFSILPTSRHLLLVAGGVGVAPLVMLADEALAQGLSVTLALGARTADEVYPARLLPDEVEYLVATEDGSLGQKGLVTDLLGGVLDWADQVFTCGPMAMLRVLKGLPRRLGATPVQASLEAHMGCGLGACYGCVVDTREGPKRVCQDGPVFDLDELVS